VHGHFFRKGRDQFGQPGMDVDDVVVDSHADLLWRLRALYGVKNTRGKRIACIGSAGGWGAGGEQAPARARAVWNFDLVTVPYSDLEARLKRARGDAALVARSRDAAARYLKDGVSLETGREFVDNAFLLTEIFRDILDETRTDAITVNNCMQTIMPVSGTTACLPLSVLNDEGYLAFCESDFVGIPAGVLLRYIADTPVFLCNASFPYDGVVTVSHCTAPRRMDGKERERARILTHYESDFGAAPKVEMRTGQAVTVLDPDFGARRWLGFGGHITGAPFYPICRSQLEIAVEGDIATLRRELRGWHWIVSYGSHVRTTSYALKKAGVDWLAV
jgi:L-fucose isomerase-like protein